MNTAVTRIDTDFDGIPDDDERLLGTDIFRADAGEDPDSDGRSNVEEYAAGTDPKRSEDWRLATGVSPAFSFNSRVVVLDADIDGLPDWWESSFFGSPTAAMGDADPDSDELSNAEEYRKGTHPLHPDLFEASVSVSKPFSVLTRLYAFDLALDRDNDGLPDWWELRYGLNATRPDSNMDGDGDGLSGIEEFLAGRDPNADDLSLETLSVSSTFPLQTIVPRLDSDGDGLPDIWEVAVGLDSKVPDSSEDADGDGLSNMAEYNAGTNPMRRDDYSNAQDVSQNFNLNTGGLKVSYWQDSDLEGMPDWWEFHYALNPLVNDALSDPDGDAVNNLLEFKFGTNPRIYDWQRPEDSQSPVFIVNTGGFALDTDADNLPDFWERQYFGHLQRGALEDIDGDGLTNVDEFRAGTNPLDSVSTLRGTVELTGTAVTVRWTTIPGKRYAVISFNDLNRPSETIEMDVIATAASHFVSFPITAQPRFFMIRAH